MDVDISALVPGIEVTYITNGRGSKRITRTGIVKEISQGEKTCAVIDLGKYRDTIYDHDLKSNEIRVINLRKEGSSEMAKINRPDKEYLESIFNKAEGNITKTAQLCEPSVSDVTMGRWLRETGIILAAGSRAAAVPTPGELRESWEESGHILARLVEKYKAPHPTIKRWLKDAGIITETATGIETIPAQNSLDKDPGPGPEDNKDLIPLTDTETQNENEQIKGADDLKNDLEELERENEAMHKIIKFYLAPIRKRVEDIENTLDSIRASYIKSHTHTHNITINATREEILNTAADLILRVAARL